MLYKRWFLRLVSEKKTGRNHQTTVTTNEIANSLYKGHNNNEEVGVFGKMVAKRGTIIKEELCQTNLGFIMHRSNCTHIDAFNNFNYPAAFSRSPTGD